MNAKAEPNYKAVVSFTVETQEYNFAGFSDTTFEWYKHAQPEMYTPEYIKEQEALDPNAFSGRLASYSLDTLFSISVYWPVGKTVHENEIALLEKDTVWTLTWMKNNYDTTTKEITGKHAGLTWYSAHDIFESKQEPAGFVYFEKITKISAKTYMAAGTFMFTNEKDEKLRWSKNGKFKMKFFTE